MAHTIVLTLTDEELQRVQAAKWQSRKSPYDDPDEPGEEYKVMGNILTSWGHCEEAVHSLERQHRI